MQTLIAEQKLRTQRIIGKLIQEGQEKGEIASQSIHGRGIQASIPDGNTRKTLSDIGLTGKQSHFYQKIADIPEKEAVFSSK